MNIYYRKILKFLYSLKFAVINLVSLAVLSAIGTFLESYYGIEYAQAYIYQSIWMKLALLSLFTNILSVLISRWPWKKRQTGFVLAHFGILILIIGSFVTQIDGVDGFVRIPIGEKARSLSLNSEMLVVYSSFDGKQMRKMYDDRGLQFLKNTPTSQSPYEISLENLSIKITDYYPYATHNISYAPDKDGGWSVLFRLEGKNAQMTDWIHHEKIKSFTKKKFGQAFIVIAQDKKYQPTEPNELILIPKNSKKIAYTLISKGQMRGQGFLKKGDSIFTGWMDLKFHLNHFYKSRPVNQFKKSKRSSDQTVSAIQVQFQDQTRWQALNSFVYFYLEDHVYTLGYINESIPLGGEIILNDFQIERYMRGSKPKEYKSFVTLDNKQKAVISMNEPLKYKGWTIYQSSFEENESGQALTSIFSVNKDPGRFIKYFGSLLIVLGILALFYSRRKIY